MKTLNQIQERIEHLEQRMKKDKIDTSIEVATLKTVKHGMTEDDIIELGKKVFMTKMLDRVRIYAWVLED